MLALGACLGMRLKLSAHKKLLLPVPPAICYAGKFLPWSGTGAMVLSGVIAMVPSGLFYMVTSGLTKWI